MVGVGGSNPLAPTIYRFYNKTSQNKSPVIERQFVSDMVFLLISSKVISEQTEIYIVH